MGHPIMFDDADPVLARLRALSLALPEAKEKVSHGRPTFFTKKVFAYYGGSVRAGGEWVQHPASLIVLVEPDERPALEQDRRVFVPAYLGPYGWLGLDLVHDFDEDPDEQRAGTDWQEVAELVESSYRLTAPGRCIRALDAD